MGLTGGIASGKSSVSSVLRDLGAIVIDADIISRQIIEPGKEAWKEIIDYFGKGVIKNGGVVDRKVLGDIVFSDEEKLRVLNNITHPKIINKIKELVQREKEKNREGVIVIDAALLIELGMHKMVDEVWVVAVNEERQLERLLKREKDLTKEQAIERIYSQMPTREKLKYAHRVIDNSGSFEDTKKQVLKLWTELQNDIKEYREDNR
nr:dephospho-CoA kinase [Koleobacter methoxysyntrophicus]